MSDSNASASPHNETERAVWEAAEAIENEGRDVTYEAIRTRMGRGSSTTIGKYLNSYFARTRRLARLPALPAAREDRIVKLGQELVQAVILEARVELQGEIADATALAAEGIAAAHRDRDEAFKQLEVTKGDLTELEATHELVQRQRDGLDRQVAGLEARLEEADARLREARTRIEHSEGRIERAERELREQQKRFDAERVRLADAHGADVKVLKKGHRDELEVLSVAQGQLKQAYEATHDTLTQTEVRLQQSLADFASLTDQLRHARELADRQAGQIQAATAKQGVLEERERATVAAMAALRSDRDRERENGDRARETAAQRLGQVETLEATIRRLEAALQQQKAIGKTPKE